MNGKTDKSGFRAQKYAAILLAVILCGGMMIHYHNTHSAREILRQEGIRLYRTGDYEDAGDMFSLALRQHEFNDDASEQDIYKYLASGELKQEKYSSALIYYQRLAQMKTADAIVYENMGICYEKSGNMKEALRSYRQAVNYPNVTREVYLRICEDELEDNDLKTAVRYARKGLSVSRSELSEKERKALDSGRGDLTLEQQDDLTKHARLLYISGAYADALKVYKMLKDSGSEGADSRIAACLIASGKGDEAGEYVSAAVSSDASDTFTRVQQSMYLMEQGQYSQALDAIENVIGDTKGYTYYRLLYDRALAFEYTGDFDSAYDSMREYVDHNGDDDTGVRELDFLTTRLSDEKAREVGADNGNLENQS